MRGVAIDRLGSRFGLTGSDRKRDRSTGRILSKMARYTAPACSQSRPSHATSHDDGRVQHWRQQRAAHHVSLPLPFFLYSPAFSLNSSRIAYASSPSASTVAHSQNSSHNSGQHLQYFFSTSCTRNASVSRYSPIAARFDFRTCNDTYDALYTSAIAFSVQAMGRWITAF